MGAGLYDPAFATLGRLYGQRATLGHHDADPVRRFCQHRLLAALGFPRCTSWLARRVPGLCRLPSAVALPVYLFVLPRELRRPRLCRSSPNSRAPAPASRDFRGSTFLLLAATITLSSVISTTMSVHLLTILQAKGLALAAAVGLGALVGPSQVAARTVEMVIARFHHPIWTKVASTSLVATGLAALWREAPIIPLALALYGAGIGLESIARGTLPLAIFGPERYPVIMGRIAMPSLIAQAAAPSIGTALIEAGGVDGAMGVFVASAAVNVALAAALFWCRTHRRRAVISPVEAGTPPPEAERTDVLLDLGRRRLTKEAGLGGRDISQHSS